MAESRRSFDRELQTYCLGYGNEGRESRVSPQRQGAIQALALDAGGLGYLGQAASGFGDAAQGSGQALRWEILALRRGSPLPQDDSV
jgi:hypothetical protein